MTQHVLTCFCSLSDQYISTAIIRVFRSSVWCHVAQISKSIYSAHRTRYTYIVLKIAFPYPPPGNAPGRRMHAVTNVRVTSSKYNNTCWAMVFPPGSLLLIFQALNSSRYYADILSDISKDFAEGSTTFLLLIGGLLLPVSLNSSIFSARISFILRRIKSLYASL